LVLEQRGLEGNGWSSAWKMATWARLGNAGRAMDNFAYAVAHYTTQSLFSICSNALQVDGSFGMTAAIAEMLLQSHEGELHLLPVLPASWKDGDITGLRGRGGFEVSLRWQGGALVSGTLTSSLGQRARVRSAAPLEVTLAGKPVGVTRPEANVLEFDTAPGVRYSLSPRR
jgi:alpha-L-fucosidase 2